MNRVITMLATALLCCCCATVHYRPYRFDNGDDYIQDGMYRIVDNRGRIGYADEKGKPVIKPRFAFGFPFKNGKAKVTGDRVTRRVPLLGERRVVLHRQKR